MNNTNLILITGALTGAGNESLNDYQEIVAICKTFNDFTVLSPFDTMSFKGSVEEKYTRGIELASLANIHIAKVDSPSTMQGVEIETSFRSESNLIFIAQKGKKVSSPIIGMSKLYEIPIIEYVDSIDEIQDALIAKISELRSKDILRLTKSAQ